MNAVATLQFGDFIGRRSGALENEGFFFSEIAHHAPQQVPEHEHVDAHFVWIVTGDYLTSARGIDSRCGARTLIYNPPGTAHRDRFCSDRGRFFTVSVKPERFADFRKAGGSLDYPRGFVAGALPWLCARAYREFRHEDSLSSLVLEGLALELLGAAGRRDPTSTRACPPWLRRARALIHDGPAPGLTLTMIAADVGVHPYHLTRAYRKHFGQNPGEDLRNCRIQRATELLRRKRLAIADVALACGYADQSQFTRSFKRVMGVTPGAFRRQA